MAEQTEENKIAKTGEIAEVKARETINNIENSNFGKKIPTELHDISLVDIVKFAILSSTVNFLPCYIIFGRSFDSKFDHIRAILFLCFIVCSVATFMFTIVSFSTNTTSFFRYCLFSAIGKAGFSLILMIMSNIRQQRLQLLLSLVYYAYIDIADFFLLYYLALYFKRIESEEYDDNGNPIANNKEENNPK